jgi:exopolysaccharide biosynthesis polyprenyl glycosylphosphotransferase
MKAYELVIYKYINLKRLIDIIVSLFGLIIMLPVFIVISMLIKLDSKGPIFFIQERAGLFNRTFYIIKFRTMIVHKEKVPLWTRKNDLRITRIGHLLRRTRLDELPQLINVLKGEMSLIGPRPERPYFVTQFSKQLPEFNNRMKIKPGITGWAQVNGGYDISQSEKLRLDLEYIDKRSVELDLKILVKTIRIIITGEGSR